jgi:hypothetical protein
MFTIRSLVAPTIRRPIIFTRPIKPSDHPYASENTVENLPLWKDMVTHVVNNRQRYPKIMPRDLNISYGSGVSYIASDRMIGLNIRSYTNNSRWTVP